jgi:hypothetical protein
MKSRNITETIVLLNLTDFSETVKIVGRNGCEETAFDLSLNCPDL